MSNVTREQVEYGLALLAKLVEAQERQADAAELIASNMNDIELNTRRDT